MESTNQKTINYTLAAIIAVLLLGFMLMVIFNGKNKKNLRAEKLVSENLLAGKSQTEAELARLKNDFNTLKQQYDENAKQLAESNAKIADDEKRINSLSREIRTLRGNSRELEDLKKTKADMEKEIARMKLDNENLNTRNRELQDRLAAMESEQNKLAEQLEKANLYDSDNFLATATRGKKTEKVVIFASRAKKLNVAFEVPQSLTENISFKIVTPSGSTVSDDKAVSWVLINDSRNLTASLSAVTGEFEKSRKVVLNYTPKTKLEKGEYRIHILSNGNNIGNCRMVLK